MNVLIILTVVMVSQRYTYVKAYQIVHLHMQFIICQLSLSKPIKIKS